MKSLTAAALISLLSLSLHADAATRAATMQVSFVISESCTIQTTGTAAQPSVACQHASPFQVQAGEHAAAAAQSGVLVHHGADAVTVYF